MSWLPSEFQTPTRVDVPGTECHFRPISPDDTELDMVAVMGSQERLWSIYGVAWEWPPVSMTAEEDRADLARHADEMERKESFNFAIFDADETELLGCIYVDPAERVGADAEVSWWVVDDMVGNQLDQSLAVFVPMWITTHWPFSKPRLIGVDITWDEWLALPEIRPVAG